MGLLDYTPIGMVGNALGDNFFGGSSSSTERNINLTPEQEALLKTLTGQAQTGLAKPTPSYPGQMYTPQTGLEGQYFNFAGGLDNPARTTALNKMFSGEVPYDVGANAGANFFDTSVYPTANRTFQEDTLPQLTEKFAGYGFDSDATRNAVRKSLVDFNTNMTAQRGGYMYQDVQAERAAKEAALQRVLGASGAMDTGNATNASILSNASTMERGVANEKVVADLQRWLSGEQVGGTSLPSGNSSVQLAMALLGINPYTYSQNQQGAGLGYSLLAGGAQGAGMAAGAALIGDDRPTSNLGASLEDVKALKKVRLT